jgi:putative oxidoreductase
MLRLLTGSRGARLSFRGMKMTAPTEARSPSTSSARIEALSTGLLPLTARLLICAIFVQGALGKILGWSGQADYLASHGMRFIPPLLAAALVIEVLGVLALLTGFYARAAALVMFVYLGIVSVMLHNFWTLSGMSAGAGQTAFLKNVGIMGGLLMISAFGPGRWALGKSRN